MLVFELGEYQAKVSASWFSALAGLEASCKCGRLHRFSQLSGLPPLVLSQKNTWGFGEERIWGLKVSSHICGSSKFQSILVAHHILVWFLLVSQSLSTDNKSAPLTTCTEIRCSSLVMKAVASLCSFNRGTSSLEFSSSLLFDSLVKKL